MRASGQYIGGKGVAWSVSVETVDEAIGFRRAAELFFRRIGDSGIEAVIRALTLTTDRR